MDDDVDVQLATLVLQVAIVELLGAYGVRPAIHLGHGAGEVVAAYGAGAMSMEDAIALGLARAEALEALPATGKMVALRGSEARVVALLASLQSEAAVAAVNGGEATVIAGPAEAVDAVAEAFPGRPIPLPGHRALHTSWVGPALGSIEAAATRIEWRPTEGRLVSGLTGGVLPDVTARHWRDQAREPVRFGDAVAAAAALGCDAFVEIAPAPALLGLARRATDPAGRLFLPTLGRDRVWPGVLEAVGTLWTRGLPLDWDGIDAPWSRATLVLPTTPFHRQRLWVDALPPAALPAPRPEVAAPVTGDLRTVVRALAAHTLGAAGEDLVPDRPLAWQGLDSMMATDLKAALDRALGVDLPLDAIIAGPSLEALVALLDPLVADARPRVESPLPAEAPPPVHAPPLVVSAPAAEDAVTGAAAAPSAVPPWSTHMAAAALGAALTAALAWLW